MYVNDYTLRLGDDGRAALTRLFEEAHRRRLLPAVPPIDPV
jgi:predicted solute-binding protein